MDDFSIGLKAHLTKIIGDNIYKYRIESGLTQEKLELEQVLLPG